VHVYVQASEQLQQPVPVVPAAELRERDFGAFELCSDENYPTVWAQDAISTASRPTPDGESSLLCALTDSAAQP
jgi:hypothetical protein